MLWREFRKTGRPAGHVERHGMAAVWLEDYSSKLDLTKIFAHRWFNPFEVRWWIPPTQAGAAFAKLKDALAGFDAKVAGLLAKGWSETEASTTRRVFGYPGARKPKSFWAASLDGLALTVRFGKVLPGNPETAGRRMLKTFESIEPARKAYHKLIALKMKAGYKEMWPRATEYSRALGGSRHRQAAVPARRGHLSSGKR